MLVIYGLETTNMAFITLIQALCQQSFGLTLPQNCVRPQRTSGAYERSNKIHNGLSSTFVPSVAKEVRGARWLRISRSSRTVRTDRAAQRGKKSPPNGPRRGTGTYSATLLPASTASPEADSTRKVAALNG